MRTRPRLRSAATIAGLAAIVVLSVGEPGAALPACSTVGHTNGSGILLTSNSELPSAGNPNSTATAKLLAGGGLDLRTPDAQAKIQFLVAPVPAAPKLADVRRLGIRTLPLAGNGPATYQLVLDYNGPAAAGGYTTLVFVPPSAPTGWNSWNQLYGATKWWSTKAISLPPTVSPAYPGFTAAPQVAQDWSAFVAGLPDATVSAYGFGQGRDTLGGHNYLGYVRFGTVAGCTMHSWRKPKPAPSPTPTQSASATPTQSASSSPSTSASATSSTSASPSATGSGSPSASSSEPGVIGVPTATDGPPADDGGSLPVTGPALGLLTLGGVAAVTLGVVSVVLARRRRAAHR